MYDGTLAEVVAVPRSNVVPKPEGLSWEHAACLPTAWLTAYRMLFTNASVQPGSTVLVRARPVAMATALVQLGSAAGLRMWVTSRDAAKGSTPAHARGGPRLRERGTVARAGGCRHGDRGCRDLVPLVNSLRPGGTIVISGATSGDAPARAELTKIYFKQLRVVGSTMGSRPELERLTRFVVDAGIEPTVDSVRPLAEAREGFRRMADGEVSGEIVFTVS